MALADTVCADGATTRGDVPNNHVPDVSFVVYSVLRPICIQKQLYYAPN